jgi:hypothetical protein
MHDSQRFQRRLTARILALLGAASLVAPAAGCQGAVSRATGGAPHGSGAASTAGTGGTSSSSASTGGVTAAGGAGGAGGGAQVAPTKVCLQWPFDLDGGADGDTVYDGPCPVDATLVVSLFESLGCPRGFEPSTIVAGPLPLDGGGAAGECCYECGLRVCGPGGRPYLDGGHALLATVEKGGGAGGWREGAPPRVDDLTAAERAELAAAWTRDALLEHASVASFSRAALALLAAGAPAELLARTHEAALDEVRHARLCFALASTYAGEARDPGRFPLGGSVAIPVTLAEIAASVVEEGCVGETVAAIVAAEQLARAKDPAVRAALARIADDEARHAELAWRTVAWAVDVGGADVRSAVARAFFAAIRAAQEAPAAESLRPSTTSEAHGRLDGATAARVTATAVADVVTPAAWTLMRLSEPARIGISAASSLPV